MPPSQKTLTLTSTSSTQVIGGGFANHQDSTRQQPLHTSLSSAPPRLPVELSRTCCHLAGIAVLEDDQDDQNGQGKDSTSLRLLSLAAVCRSWYECILSQFLLPKVSLFGAKQLNRLCFSLKLPSNAILRKSMLSKTKRLSLVQRSKHQSASGDQRRALYDFLSSLTEFENACLASLFSVLSLRAHAIEELHLEMTPGVLRDSWWTGKMTPSHDVRTTIRSLSFLLSTFGGVGCEDVFVGLNKANTSGNGNDDDDEHGTRVHGLPSRSPWANLTHIQISGPAGFRVSMSTASSLGSLPALTHLSLVMPNFVRDASMRGDMNASPPAALQLLLLLLADQLQEFLIIGHDAPGYMGWHGIYDGWLDKLTLPHAVKERRKDASTIRARLVMASGAPHPNYYTAWMVARAQEASQWEWKSGSRSEADIAHHIEWKVQEWLLPFAAEPQEQQDTEAYSQETDARRQQSQSQSQQWPASAVHQSARERAIDSEFLGIDDLD